MLLPATMGGGCGDDELSNPLGPDDAEYTILGVQWVNPTTVNRRIPNGRTETYRFKVLIELDAPGGSVNPVAIALDDDEWDPGGDDLVYVFPLNADASTLSAGDRIELDGEVTLDCTGDEITGVGVAIRMNDDEIRSGEGEPGDPAEIYVSAKRVDGSQSVDGPELDIECAP
jgi:hypothetical protein